MKERFMKNGVFSLEYDKETLRDMVLEKQEEIQKQKEAINKINEFIKELYDNTDDTTCYDIDKNIKEELLDILKEVSK